MSELRKEEGVDAFAYLSLANDTEVLRVMRSLQDALTGVEVEWENAPTFHVSICYASEVLNSALFGIMSDMQFTSSIEISSSQLGIFENGDERVLHIAVDNSEPLAALQAHIFEQFTAQGLDMSSYSEPDNYHPHITLAYLPEGVELPELVVDLQTRADTLVLGRDNYEPFAEVRIYDIADIKAVVKENGSGGLRLMLLVTSNAYRDREGEIIREKALRQYVESSWSDGEFIGEDSLLVWHGGDAIGEIIYADMEGPFLIEVARELPDDIVNLAISGEEAVRASIKEVWDGMDSYPDALGTSHRFYHLRRDKQNGVYENIYKFETSILPLDKAANQITSAEILVKEK